MDNVVDSHKTISSSKASQCCGHKLVSPVAVGQVELAGSFEICSEADRPKDRDIRLRIGLQSYI